MRRGAGQEGRDVAAEAHHLAIVVLAIGTASIVILPVAAATMIVLAFGSGASIVVLAIGTPTMLVPASVPAVIATFVPALGLGRRRLSRLPLHRSGRSDGRLGSRGFGGSRG